MARVRMVTRTVEGTKLTVLCMNVTTCEPCTECVTLGVKVDTPDKALKLAKKELETDELKVVHVTSMESVNKMYGMLEADFIKNAKELDPETRKILEAETEETETEETETEETEN